MLHSKSEMEPFKDRQKLIFPKVKDQIEFKYHKHMPNKPSPSTRRNLCLPLTMYALYRNTVHDAYKVEPGLTKDIRQYKNAYESKDEIDPHYKQPLYHYSVTASLGAIQEWNDPSKNIQSYIAYDTRSGHKVGFIHFREDTVNGKPVVYIAQAGVSQTGAHVGRRLMECVLAHYSPNTEFYILTRVFNTKAKDLYGKRFGFTPIELPEIKELGYDERYCGFKHTTTPEELLAIKRKIVIKDGTSTQKKRTNTIT